MHTYIHTCIHTYIISCMNYDLIHQRMYCHKVSHFCLGKFSSDITFSNLNSLSHKELLKSVCKRPLLKDIFCVTSKHVFSVIL